MREQVIKRLYAILLFILRGVHFLFRITPSKRGDEIVILALKRIGDTVLMLPALEGFLRLQTGKKTVIVCHASNAEIIKRYLPAIECLIPGEEDLLKKYPLPKLGFLRKVRSRKAKLIIDVTGDYSSTPYLFCNRTRDIIGANLLKYQFLYTKYVPIRTTPHLHDLYYDILTACDHRLSRNFRGFPRKSGSIARIGINPFAGWLSKQWSTNRFIAFSRWLQAKYSVIWIIQSGSLKDDYLKELQVYGIDVAETKTVGELISAISNVDLFVGNDSGPIHLAALAGLPTFAIYGPTSPEYIKPVGDHHGFVRTAIPCIPVKEHYCFTDAGHTCPSYECMSALTVDSVIQSFRQFIEILGQRSNES